MFRLTATSSFSGKASFKTTAENFVEIEYRLKNLHSYIKKTAIEPHNISIQNENTGEVFNVKISSAAGIQRGY